jgi:hypothetical protein|tara:strand:- start:888 stop:1232 length:345 start_codon:yes stop_codon:yes gene_type:complete
MTVNDHLKRLLVETIANNINEITFGYDGSTATSSDGSAGRPALTLTPTVKIMDNSTILIEATIPSTQSFDDTLKEVYIQMRNTDDFTPIARHTFRPILKNSENELIAQIIMEVQ